MSRSDDDASFGGGWAQAADDNTFRLLNQWSCFFLFCANFLAAACWNLSFVASSVCFKDYDTGKVDEREAENVLWRHLSFVFIWAFLRAMWRNICVYCFYGKINKKQKNSITRRRFSRYGKYSLLTSLTRCIFLRGLSALLAGRPDSSHQLYDASYWVMFEFSKAFRQCYSTDLWINQIMH